MNITFDPDIPAERTIIQHILHNYGDNITPEPLNVEKRKLDNSINDDLIMDLSELARYMKVSENWIYKNSHVLPKIQNGKRGKLHFSRSDIDKWLENQSKRGMS